MIVLVVRYLVLVRDKNAEMQYLVQREIGFQFDYLLFFDSLFLSVSLALFYGCVADGIKSFEVDGIELDGN